MRAVAADLIGVRAGGLVAVVTVGDQELGVGEGGGDRFVELRIGDPPHAVDGAVRIRDLAPRGARHVGLDLAPDGAGVEGEDGRQVVAGRLGGAGGVLLPAGGGAPVGGGGGRGGLRYPPA